MIAVSHTGDLHGCKPGRFVVFDHQALQPLAAVLHFGLSSAIAQASQRDDAPDHRRKNRAQAVAAGEALDHPARCRLQRPLRSGVNPMPLQEFEQFVDERKKRSQLNNRRLCFKPGQRGYGHSSGSFRNSSRMPRSGSICAPADRPT